MLHNSPAFFPTVPATPPSNPKQIAQQKTMRKEPYRSYNTKSSVTVPAVPSSNLLKYHQIPPQPHPPATHSRYGRSAAPLTPTLAPPPQCMQIYASPICVVFEIALHPLAPFRRPLQRASRTSPRDPLRGRGPRRRAQRVSSGRSVQCGRSGECTTWQGRAEWFHWIG